MHVIYLFLCLNKIPGFLAGHIGLTVTNSVPKFISVSISHRFARGICHLPYFLGFNFAFSFPSLGSPVVSTDQEGLCLGLNTLQA